MKWRLVSQSSGRRSPRCLPAVWMSKRWKLVPVSDVLETARCLRPALQVDISARPDGCRAVRVRPCLDSGENMVSIVQHIALNDVDRVERYRERNTSDSTGSSPTTPINTESSRDVPILISPSPSEVVPSSAAKDAAGATASYPMTNASLPRYFIRRFIYDSQLIYGWTVLSFVRIARLR